MFSLWSSKGKHFAAGFRYVDECVRIIKCKMYVRWNLTRT